MANHNLPLALTFLRTHPESAAAILERHDLRDVAAFMAEVPPSYAAPVLQRLLPHTTARLSVLLGVAGAAGMLLHLEPGLIATILRHLDARKRALLLQEFPAKIRFSCNLLLAFSHGAVGAWMTPNIAAVSHTCTVREALHHLGTTDDVIHSDYVFAVDRQRTLRGRIRYTELLRADPGLSVGVLTRTGCRALLGRMLIRHAAEHRDWEHDDVMPVLNRSRQFIGALRHVDLRKGLDQLEETIDSKAGQNPLTGIGEVYGHTLLALFHAMGHIAESDLRS